MSSDARSGLAARTKARPSGWLGRAPVVLWAVGALACAGIDFQQGAVVTLQGFKTQGRAENGARWRLQGESAVIRGAVYELVGVTVHLDLEDGRTAKITSRACVYHQDSGLVESHDAVRMESGETSLYGVGFDMLMSERRLRVRDEVRMEIGGVGGSLNSFGPTATEKRRPGADAPVPKSQVP